MTNSADPDWLKPTDLDLHCLLRQGMSCSAREGLKREAKPIMTVLPLLKAYLFLFKHQECIQFPFSSFFIEKISHKSST